MLGVLRKHGLFDEQEIEWFEKWQESACISQAESTMEVEHEITLITNMFANCSNPSNDLVHFFEIVDWLERIGRTELECREPTIHLKLSDLTKLFDLLLERNLGLRLMRCLGVQVAVDTNSVANSTTE